jgi:glucose/arabinose dehydrogenase
MNHLLSALARLCRPAAVRKAARPIRRSFVPRLEFLEDRAVPTTLPNGFQETLVAGGLGTPTAMTLAPDGRVFITTQNGDLRVVKNGALLPTPFLHVNVDSNGERGLLGVAFDPNFSVNHFLYVYYTVPGTGVHNRVSRFTADAANPDVAAAGSEKDLLDLDPLSTATNHNGGAIHFGSDGMLYVAVGDNANAANSQTLSDLLGKVLRLDVAQITASDPANSAKLIPSDNPFVGQVAGIDQLIYALGFRNPFTFAVQPGSGIIFVNDVGESTWEEIDKLTAGGNYGWNKSEGFALTVPPAGLGPGTYQDPQLAYNHSGGPAGGGIAIVGGVFYNPPAGAANSFPAAYVGKYFYEDLGGNWIRVFDPTHPGIPINPDTSSGFATGTVGNPVDIVVAPDGGLYYLARGGGGELLKISFTGFSPQPPTPPSPPAPPSPPPPPSVAMVPASVRQQLLLDGVLLPNFNGAEAQASLAQLFDAVLALAAQQSSSLVIPLLQKEARVWVDLAFRQTAAAIDDANVLAADPLYNTPLGYGLGLIEGELILSAFAANS